MNFSGLRKTFSKSIQSVSSNKVLNNEFLYKVVVVLSLLNMISYIVSKNVNAVIVFTIVYLATNYLTNNMTIVLLVAVFVTNFLIVTKKIKENYENKDNKEGQKKMVGKKNVSNEEKFSNEENETGKEGMSDEKETEEYDNIAKKLEPAEIAPVEFNADSAELTKQLKILNERTQNSMGMINKLGGIANISKMIDSLTSIVNKLN